MESAGDQFLSGARRSGYEAVTEMRRYTLYTCEDLQHLRASPYQVIESGIFQEFGLELHSALPLPRISQKFIDPVLQRGRRDWFRQIIAGALLDRLNGGFG